MSANRGFSGGSVEDDDGYSAYRNSGFASAMRAYDSRSVGPDPAPAPGSAAKPPPGASALRAPLGTIPLPKVKLEPRVLKFTAKWAVIFCVDTTASMREWPREIFDRLGTLCTELSAILHDPVQVLFIGFGDIPKCGDKFEVTPIGSGPELLGYLAVLDKDGDGGGNEVESSDLCLEFAARMLDTSECSGTFQFIITDEKVAAMTDFGHLAPWTDTRGKKVEPRLLAGVVRDLKIKQDTFAIIKPYGDVPDLKEGQDPDFLYASGFTKQVLDHWGEVLGTEWVAKLWDKRRLVDVVVGCIAKRVGKYAEFVSRLESRHLIPGNSYGPMNVSTVLTSVAGIGGSASPPVAKSRMLLPAAVIDVEEAPPPGVPPTVSRCLLPPDSSPK